MRRAGRIVAAVALALAVSTVVASGFWTSAAGAVGTFDAAAISVAASGASSVTVTWTLQATLQPDASQNGIITYAVERRLGSGAYAAVASGPCSGAKAHGTTSCIDTPAVDGSYSYRVVATFRTWTATSSAAGPIVIADTTPPTASAVVTPTPNGAGWNTTSPVAVTLSASDTGSGVASINYTTDGSTPTGASAVYATPLSISATGTTTVKYFATDVAGNPSLVQTQLVKIDTLAPANAIMPTNITGGAFQSSPNATVYFRGSAAGSLTLSNLVTDATSGPASSATTALTGTTTNWTPAHVASVVSGAAPYVSNVFTWTAGATGSANETVTGSDVAGKTTATALTFTDDSIGPAGGAISSNVALVGTGGLYSTTTSLSLARTAVTDAGSGVATGALLLRASSPLTNGVCTGYGGYTTTVATDPSFPYTDAVADNTCYRYRYRSFDRVGNFTNQVTGDFKVDTTPPGAPTFALSALTNAYWNAGASTLYYRSNLASGSFTVTTNSVDVNSGILSYAMPTLGAGWTTPSGTTGVQTYAWSTTNPTTTAGVRNAIATSNSSLTSTAGFTLAADITSPAGGSVSYADGVYTTGSVALTLATGTDGGSGLNTASGVLQRQSATLTGNTCGGYGGFSNVAAYTSPALSFTDSTVATGNCYRYRYLFSDNLGNTRTYTSANVAKVTTYQTMMSGTSSLVNYWRLGENPPLASDTFTGTSATALTSHTGELGATWTNTAVGSASLVLSTENRLRKSGTTFNYYLASATPASADYAVEADLYVKSLVAGDKAGVAGRFNATAPQDWYEAFYDVTAGQWQIRESVNTVIGPALGTSSSQTLVAGSTYRLRLEMLGTVLKLYVDGALKVNTTDATLATAGKGAIFSGGTATSTGSDTTGLHLDEFRILAPTTTTTAVDSKAANNGAYVNGAETMSRSEGALSGDASTALSFDGFDDYISVARQISLDMTIEFWFKSTQGYGVDFGGPGGTPRWTQSAGMVDNNVTGTANDFGIGLRSDGTVIGGVGGGSTGSGDLSALSVTGGFNDGDWHQVVFTRAATGVSPPAGTFKLYVDGALEATAIHSTPNTAALTAQANITFGKLASVTSPSPNFFRGSLDEIATYNAVLDAATVLTHCQAGKGTSGATC